MVAFPIRRFLSLLPWALLLLLVGCGNGGDEAQESQATATPVGTVLPWDAAPRRTATPAIPMVDLSLTETDVSVAPVPLRAGFPFSVTAVIHNKADIPAVNMPLMFHISADREELGFMSFLQLLTVTVPASDSLPVTIPVNWNLAGGEHQLWVQVNRLPQGWQSWAPPLPEADSSDNIVLMDLLVNPFDAYVSDLCPDRVDVEIEPADILPEPEQQRVRVRVHNSGNRAVYNLPVVIVGDQLTGIAYTPAIPPCGGTTEVYVDVDRPLRQGESLTVHVNPQDWGDSLQEDNFDNNRLAIAAGLAPGMVISASSIPQDYDFSISTADLETPQLWLVLVTVHNLGTRDAAMVPIRVENEAGRKITDAIPLVQGNGLGVAAIRVGYLWTRGGTLTFTVNPQGAKGAYPETNQDNNVATLALP